MRRILNPLFSLPCSAISVALAYSVTSARTSQTSGIFLYGFSYKNKESEGISLALFRAMLKYY